MTTTLSKSLQNAIVLFVLALISAMIVDYQAHGYPPSPGVLYIAVLTALFAFLTTVGSQAIKDRKEKKEAIERGKELEKLINSSSPDPDPPGNPSQTQPNAQQGAAAISSVPECKRDDWLVGLVI